MCTPSDAGTAPILARHCAARTPARLPSRSAHGLHCCQPRRSTVGHLTLDQSIGVRIPTGLPSCNSTRFPSAVPAHPDGAITHTGNLSSLCQTLCERIMSFIMGRVLLIAVLMALCVVVHAENGPPRAKIVSIKKHAQGRVTYWEGRVPIFDGNPVYDITLRWNNKTY